jgi:hypothetical protein
MGLKCSRCDADNPDDAYFCGNCGHLVRSKFGSSRPVTFGSPTAPAAEPVPYAPVSIEAPASLAPLSEPAALVAPAPPAALPPLSTPASPSAAVEPSASAEAPSQVDYAPAENAAAETFDAVASAEDGAVVLSVGDYEIRVSDVELAEVPVAQRAEVQAELPPPPPAYDPFFGPQVPVLPAPPAARPDIDPALRIEPTWPFPARIGLPEMRGAATDGDTRNTSGTGKSAELPPQARGWNFAGFVPFGLFAFSHQLPLLGVLGVFAMWMGPLYYILGFIIGFKGKEWAWQYRKFSSVQQYEKTIEAWNKAGVACLLLSFLIVFIFMLSDNG